MSTLKRQIQLDEIQKDFILTNLDNDGRLSCLKAFKVSRLIGLKPIDMADACESVGIQISNCKLGVFGNIKFQNAKTAKYRKIEQNFTQDKNVSCKTLWYIAHEASLKRVGNTLVNSDINENICQFGCFNKRKEHHEIKN